MVHAASSFGDLDFIVPHGTEFAQSIKTTMIYIDNVIRVTDTVIHLTCRLGPMLQHRGIIRPIHAWMPDYYRTHALQALIDGKVRIVVCTEAAGMVSCGFVQPNNGTQS